MTNVADIDFFNQLFKDYEAKFIRFANSYVRDQTVAEDVTIESLMYYWENRKSLDANTNVPAYILTTIKHKCLNYLNRQQVREEVSEKLKDLAIWELNTQISSLQACEPMDLFTAETQAIVDETLASLSEQTRKIFIMSRYEGRSYKEIAQTLGITTKGVEFHMNKALKALRIQLKDYFPLFFFLFC